MPKRSLRASVPEFVASDGVPLHFEDRGAGAPLLFLHGWTMSSQFFRRQWEALAAKRRCIALDLRGCGASQTRAGSNTMDRLAQDVEELLAHLRLSSVTLVGWSMGGGLTMRYLDRFGPKRLRGVVLVDFPPRFEEALGVAEKVCQRMRTDRSRFIEAFLRRMFSEPLSEADRVWMLEEHHKCPTEVACELYGQLGVGDARGRVYDVPALLVFPEQGWFRNALPLWREIFPHAEAPSFPQSRHCPFWEEADRFNQALLAFTQ